MTKKGTRMISVLLSLAVAAVGLTAALTRGFTVWNHNQPVTPGTSGVYDGAGNELVSGKVYPLSSNMVFTAPSAESPLAEDGVTLQATVKPDTATNKALDWTVAFVNPASAWATGKAVSDYVSVTPTSNGADTATVTCNEPFGEQIRITVTSRSNANAKAECVVDFAKRVESVSVKLASTLLEPLPAASYTIRYNKTVALQYEFLYSAYTIDVDYETALYIRLNPSIYDRLFDLGFDYPVGMANRVYLFTYSEDEFTLSPSIFEELLSSEVFDNPVQRNKVLDLFCECAEEGTPVLAIEAEWTCSSDSPGTSDIGQLGLNLDPTGLPYQVENVSLNHGTLTF